MPTAIITGGAIRLGRAMALHLAEKGSDIALLYHSSTEQANQCLEEIRGRGRRCKGYPFNLEKFEDIPDIMEKITGDFSDIRILLNSASVFPAGSVEHTTTNQLKSTIHINLLAPFVLMREYKTRIGQGQIINILDQRISGNKPSHAAYSVSKVALAHLTTLAAVEFGSVIRVNGIAPGLILPRTDKDDAYFEKKGRTIPLRRTGSVEALLQGIDYLLDNTFVNGDILYIDGGESKR